MQNSDSLNTSPPSHHSEDDHQQPQNLDMLTKIESKGSKKWLEKTFEHFEVKNNVFDFEEDEKTNVILAKERPLPTLFRHCKADSSSASLLVEAVIDAAEKEVDIPGGTKVSSPQPVVVSSKSPEALYPVLRSYLTQSPSQQALGQSGTLPDYSVCGTQDHSQSPPLQVETLYSTSASPRHSGYGLLFSDRTPHYELHFSPNVGQVETFHLEESRYDSYHKRTEDNSSDDGVGVAQNLSMSIKNKSLQLDFPAAYKYDNLEDRNGLEPLEGLDMTRSCNYHHPTFVSVAPRYPPLYDQRTYSHSDILRVVNLTHSVDLSLPRNTHHQLTSSNQIIVDPIRIISPSAYQSYPLSSSPYLTFLPSRTSHSPTYHHYSSY